MRRGVGFTTINDLQRHEKCKHGIGATENVYVCAAEACKDKKKPWPRLDNFKQHIYRAHGTEGVEDLVKRYVQGFETVAKSRLGWRF